MRRRAVMRALAVASAVAIFGLGVVLLLGTPFTGGAATSPTSNIWTADLAQICGISSESAAALKASLATANETSIACIRLGGATLSPYPTDATPSP
jgi:hypothetical protein